MQVVDVMTANPRVVLPGDPLIEAAATMRDLDVGFVPVVDNLSNMRPIGVITDRDIAIRHVAAAHHHDCPVREAMTGGQLAMVRDSDGIDAVLRAMKSAAVHRVLVTNVRGRLIGVVALADLLRAAGEIGHDPIEAVMESMSWPVALQR